jgi:hypothetical protein
MKRFVPTLVAALALTLSLAGTASSADHSAPGDPDDNNCRGQTAAFMAQRFHNPVDDAPGIGNDAEHIGLSVHDLHVSRIRALCG